MAVVVFSSGILSIIIVLVLLLLFTETYFCGHINMTSLTLLWAECKPSVYDCFSRRIIAGSCPTLRAWRQSGVGSNLTPCLALHPPAPHPLPKLPHQIP